MARRLPFYPDKHSVFRVAKKDAKGGQGMTQFGRALCELNIEILCANSSQAKGRVERANRTLQDRLVKELRLAGISGMEDGNAFLPGFIERYNARFARTPARTDDLHRPLNIMADRLKDTGHHTRLSTRLLARLCRGRHPRRLDLSRLQGAILPERCVNLSIHAAPMR
jgi:hypothetical protein